MDYKVVVTAEAEEDLNQFIQYLLFAKKNKQAAKNVLDDFEDTIKKLKYVASSLRCMRQSTFTESWISSNKFSTAQIFYVVQNRK